MRKRGRLRTRSSGTNGSRPRRPPNSRLRDGCRSLNNASDTMQNVIECRSVWKIFGNRVDEALRLAQTSGAGKAELMERFQCVLGVADVSFSVAEGEIFCIMGLSGSGKSTLIRHVNRLIDSTFGEILIEGQDINKMQG